jgi:hypothetical protein
MMNKEVKMKKAEAFEILTKAEWKAIAFKRGDVYLRAIYNGKKVELRDSDTILYVNGKFAYDVGGTEEYESMFGMFGMG